MHDDLARGDGADNVFITSIRKTFCPKDWAHGRERQEDQDRYPAHEVG
jgi:hypothetical protein